MKKYYGFMLGIIFFASCVTNPAGGGKPLSVARSATMGLIPGAPQFMHGETLEGILYMSLAIGTAITSGYFYNEILNWRTSDPVIRERHYILYLSFFAGYGITTLGSMIDGGITASKRLHQWKYSPFEPKIQDAMRKGIPVIDMPSLAIKRMYGPPETIKMIYTDDRNIEVYFYKDGKYFFQNSLLVGWFDNQSHGKIYDVENSFSVNAYGNPVTYADETISFSAHYDDFYEDMHYRGTINIGSQSYSYIQDLDVKFTYIDKNDKPNKFIVAFSISSSEWYFLDPIVEIKQPSGNIFKFTGTTTKNNPPYSRLNTQVVLSLDKSTFQEMLNNNQKVEVRLHTQMGYLDFEITKAAFNIVNHHFKQELPSGFAQ